MYIAILFAHLMNDIGTTPGSACFRCADQTQYTPAAAYSAANAVKKPDEKVWSTDGSHSSVRTAWRSESDTFSCV